MRKLTENETVKILANYLKKNGWVITKLCLGRERGNDITASKSNKTLVVEAKGAKPNDDTPGRKKEYFSSGQIKIHHGEAIVKILEEKYKNPAYQFAIAHPDDEDIRKSIGHLIPFLKKLDIKHYWVSKNGSVTEG